MLTAHHIERGQSVRVVWLCEELGLKYNLKVYPRVSQETPKLLQQLHPLGSVPIITETREGSSDATPLTLAETGAILEYINTKYGNEKFSLPSSHENYADYLYWFHFGNGTLQPLFTNAFILAVTLTDPNHATHQFIQSKLASALSLLNDRLTKAKWLASEDSFTLADMTNAYSLTTMRTLVDVDLNPYPAILRWLQDVGSREAYVASMEKAEPGYDFKAALEAKAPQQYANTDAWSEENQKIVGRDKP